jgi:hypothetical protein
MGLSFGRPRLKEISLSRNDSVDSIDRFDLIPPDPAIDKLLFAYRCIESPPIRPFVKRDWKEVATISYIQEREPLIFEGGILIYGLNDIDVLAHISSERFERPRIGDIIAR